MSSSSSFLNRFLEDAEDDDDGTSSRTGLQWFTVIFSNVLLFCLIFGLSATVELRNLQHQLKNRFAIGCGVAMQFLIMPFLGFVALCFLQRRGDEFTTPMSIGLLVVTSSPGGSFSNWWCSLFNADLSLSVAMTSVSSILSLGMLPANLLFYTWLAYDVVGTGGNDETDDDDVEDIDILEELDFTAIFISLGIVLSAILLGLLASYKYANTNPMFHQRANSFGSLCGLALILVSFILGSGSGTGNENDDDDENTQDEPSNFWSLPWSFYVGVAFPCIVGIALANILARCARLSPPEVVSIAVECCYQNTGIAASVAVTMFADDPVQRAQAISVPLFYGILEAVVIGIYCVWAWKAGWTKAPADEKICVVVTHSYENDHNPNSNIDLDEPREHVEEENVDRNGNEMLERDMEMEQAVSAQESAPPQTKPTSWWASLFIPRAQEQRQEQQQSSSPKSNSPANKNTSQPGDDSENCRSDQDKDRGRCDTAEDATVSTEAPTPPCTPQTPIDTVSDSNISNNDDIEIVMISRNKRNNSAGRLSTHQEELNEEDTTQPFPSNGSSSNTVHLNHDYTDPSEATEWSYSSA